MNYTLLKEGDSGTEVTLLQQLLKINNYFPGSTTGVFGPDTTSWVTNFQVANYLEATGTATKKTWDLLYSITKSSTKNKSIINKPTLSFGDENNEVVELQTILKNLLYYNGEITGIFDEITYKSVQTFQFLNKLVPDGIVGKDTWSALIDLYTPLSNCDYNEDILYETYVVKPGDTLYSIARMFNTTVDEIKKLNNLTDNTISINQELKVLELETPTDPDTTSTYTVKAGDTLYSISQKTGVSIEKIKTINNLTSDVLSIGQVLNLREDTETPEETYETYTVKAGDTLYSISKTTGISVNELKEINNLTSDTLSIGQVLKLKKDSITEPTPPSETITYTVKAGDSLYSIAKIYNTSVDEIKNLNGLTSNLLSIGQSLLIPKTTTDSNQTYKVVAGDSLYSIAKKYNTTVEEIKIKNNLKSDVLSIGQTLYI